MKNEAGGSWRTKKFIKLPSISGHRAKREVLFMYKDSNSGHQSQHHWRFYLVLITVVVAAIFVVLFMNDSSGFNITNAIVGGDKKNASTEEFTSAAQVPWVQDEQVIEDTFSKKVSRNENKVDFSLKFNEIPSVKKKAKVSSIDLRFNDLSTKIMVNGDLLQLNNLDQVHLTIDGFAGDLKFDHSSFSLDGTAKNLKVNDISLSSKSQIKISFDHLDYNYLNLEEVELEQLDLPIGSGELKVGEKLTYALEQDQLKLYYFTGEVLVDRDADSLLTLEGVTKGISAGGALLNINLR